MKKILGAKIQGAVIAVMILIGAGRVVMAQMGVPTGLAPQNPHSSYGDKGRDDQQTVPPGTQERLERGRQTERQKKLIADTDHLLALANELKADMDKTTKDTMSIDVIKKAEEIEKLARSVKDRMKG